jgi:hypothetical protein
MISTVDRKVKNTKGGRIGCLFLYNSDEIAYCAALTAECQGYPFPVAILLKEF